MGMIQFNGNVTINGNVETYDNGSMKITSYAPVRMNVEDLVSLIEQKILDDVKREAYIKALKDLKVSEDPSIIRKAFEIVKNLGKELGISLLVQGLSPKVYEILKSMNP